MSARSPNWPHKGRMSSWPFLGPRRSRRQFSHLEPGQLLISSLDFPQGPRGWALRSKHRRLLDPVLPPSSSPLHVQVWKTSGCSGRGAGGASQPHQPVLGCCPVMVVCGTATLVHGAARKQALLGRAASRGSVPSFGAKGHWHLTQRLGDRPETELGCSANLCSLWMTDPPDCGLP